MTTHNAPRTARDGFEIINTALGLQFYILDVRSKTKGARKLHSKDFHNWTPSGICTEQLEGNPWISMTSEVNR